MGKLLSAILNALFPSGQSKRDRPQAASAVGHWLSRMPQLLNMLRYTLNALQQSEVLDYDPFYLHITPAEVHPLASSQAITSKVMAAADSEQTEIAETGELPVRSETTQAVNLQSFTFLLEQLPGILAIDFTGQIHDPLMNPELLDMVDHAYRSSRVESTVYTAGFRLKEFADALVSSSLHTLVIRMVGHKPSAYSRLTGKPPQEFLALLENVKALVKRRGEARSQLALEISLCMDIHNFQELPEMITFAKYLGLDGLRLENYLTPDSMKSDRSLYRHHNRVVHFLRQAEQAHHQEQAQKDAIPFTLKMPSLLDADMSAHRYCRDAFNTVSVDAHLNVSACSRHALACEPFGKIWDEDFFNNTMYQWLRNVYSAPSPSKQFFPVPSACQNCPKNASPH
jgi:MoaA/NifB/PqqE/SkfB family radical SAM enzyme